MRTFLRSNFSLLVMILMILAFRSSFADQYVVPTGSMEPTIIPGDHILVNKTAYDLKVPFLNIVIHEIREPRRGDVVVFKFPEDPSIDFVKRLVGLPGDHIHVVDGLITVNGEALQTDLSAANVEAQLKSSMGNFSYLEHMGPAWHSVQRIPPLFQPRSQDFIIPDNFYFFMGDNRDNSNDSRSWGFVPRSYLKGQALKVFYSFHWEHQFLPVLRWQRILHEL